MKSILEKYELLDEQPGAGTGAVLKPSGDLLESISPFALLTVKIYAPCANSLASFGPTLISPGSYGFRRALPGGATT